MHVILTQSANTFLGAVIIQQFPKGGQSFIITLSHTNHLPSYKASHSASIIASIMHPRPTKMLMWQLIKEERDN
jgi:hypothetical protein